MTATDGAYVHDAAHDDRALVDASHLLAGADDVEIAFGVTMAILARRLPLRRAALVESGATSTTVLRWSSTTGASRDRPLGETVGAVHSYFTNPSVIRRDGPNAVGDPCCISVPLAVGMQPIFATLQIVAARAVDRGDVVFVCALATLLARSLAASRAFSVGAFGRVGRVADDRYASLLDHLDGAFAWEAEGRTGQITYLSAGVETLLGHPRADWFAGANAWESVVHPDDHAAFVRAVQLALSSGRDQRCEHRCVAGDGAVRWLHTSVHVIEQVDGPLLQGVSIDVTDAKRTAREAEERLSEERGLVHAMTATLGVVAVDADARVTVVNPAAGAVLGWLAEDAGCDVADVVSLRRSDGSSVPCPLRLAIATGRINSNDEHFLLRAGAPSLPVHYTVSPIWRAGVVAGAVFSFEDITHRREAEEVHLFLLESSRLLSSGLDYTSALRQLARLAVPRLGDLCFIDLVDPFGQLRRVAFAHRDPAQDGFINDLFADAPLVAAVEEGRFGVNDVDDRWPARVEALGPVGIDPLHSLLTVAVRLGDETLGTLSFAFSTSHRRHRVTEIYTAEELARRVALALENGRLFEQTRAAVAQREQILAIVSHDLKNPLSTILLATSMLRDVLSAGDVATLQRIETASARMSRMIDDLLDFASIDAGHLAVQLAPHDAHEILQECVASFAGVARRRSTRIEIDDGLPMPPVPCDRGRVLQVLGNLVANAIKVSGDGALVTLHVGQELHPNGSRVAVFRVSDHGPGISPDELPRLFDRYWRSGDVSYRGHGLGLAIARGIVRAHGGRIWATSVLGSGAQFHFTLPLGTSNT